MNDTREHETIPNPVLSHEDWKYLERRFLDFLTDEMDPNASEAELQATEDIDDLEGRYCETDETLSFITGQDVRLPDGLHDRLMVSRYQKDGGSLTMYCLDLTLRRAYVYKPEEDALLGDTDLSDLVKFDLAGREDEEEIKKLVKELQAREG